jgi:hypothetical protein
MMGGCGRGTKKGISVEVMAKRLRLGVFPKREAGRLRCLE